MNGGQIIIDGTDIGTTYGACLSAGGVNGLLAWPGNKGNHTTSWFESNGLDGDIETIRTASLTFTLNLALSCENSTLTAFYSFLIGNISRTWEMRSIGLKMKLRTKSVSSLATAMKLHTLSLSLVCDEPLNTTDGLLYNNGTAYGTVTGCTTASGASAFGITGDTTWKIDGVNLTDYGVRVAQGSEATTLSLGATKDICVKSNDITDGQTADTGATNHTASRSISIKCVLKAPSSALLWSNYYALFNKLRSQRTGITDPTRKSAHTLTFNGTDITTYYISNSVSSFFWNEGMWWLDFTIKLQEL